MNPRINKECASHARYSIHKKSENTSSFSLYHFSGTKSFGMKTEKVHRQESLADKKKRDIIFLYTKDLISDAEFSRHKSREMYTYSENYR